jgi:DNA-binding NtrC family response regulator
VLRGWCG